MLWCSFIRPNNKVAKALWRDFFERGNPKIAWDAGINSAPVGALNFGIDTIFYAEHGESEYGGLILNKNSNKKEIWKVIEHCIGDYPENWQSETIKEQDLEHIHTQRKRFKKLNIFIFIFFLIDMYENYTKKKNL